MFIPLPILIAVGLLILVLAAKAMRTGRRDPLMGGTAAYRASKPMPTATLPADVEAQVRALIAAGRKIEAIKLARDATHLGLKETKDLVDVMERQAP